MLAVLLTPAGHYGHVTGMKFQVGTPNTPEGTQIVQKFFIHLEDAVLKSGVLPRQSSFLEQEEHLTP